MSEFIKAKNVYLDNPATSVDEALEFLAKEAVADGIASDEAAVLASFKAREAQGTTGMTSGFAIPHAKCDAINEAAIFVVKFAEPITSWESMDGQPIKAAIALLIPDGEAGSTHLSLLSKIAVLLMQESFCEKVLRENVAESIAKLVADGVNE